MIDSIDLIVIKRQNVTECGLSLLENRTMYLSIKN